MLARAVVVLELVTPRGGLFMLARSFVTRSETSVIQSFMLVLTLVLYKADFF